LKGLELHPVEIINIERRKQPIALASYRARIFCTACNTHFGRPEEAAIPPRAYGARARSSARSGAAAHARTLGREDSVCR
jgi:hypothetical protein